jgi:transposase-like protein
LGISLPTLYDWLTRYSLPEAERSELQGQAAEIRRLKAELKRVREERDILKNSVLCQRVPLGSGE